MFIQKLVATLCLLLTLTACSLGATTEEPIPTATITPILTATQVATSTVTQTPTPRPSATATLRPATSVPAACTNDLTFIADMSLPDGVAVTAGAVITKTWRVQNDGTCAWNSNYTFRQIGGDALTAASIASPIVGTGQIADISVTLTVGTDLASYDDLERASFSMFTPSSVPFGDMPYVEVSIQVPDNTSCSDGLTIVSSPSEIGIVAPNETLPISWTIRNSGTCTWTGYTVEQLGNGSALTGTNLPLTLPNIAPNQSHTFTVNIGIAEGTFGFGLATINLAVMNANNAASLGTLSYEATFDSTTGCEWDSDFVEDVTIPDGTVVTVGEAFTKTWRLENSGTCTWSNFRLLLIEDEDSAFEIIGVNNFVILPVVAVGEQVDISVTLRLRDTVASGETVRARFQIQGVESTFFGTMPFIEVQAE